MSRVLFAYLASQNPAVAGEGLDLLEVDPGLMIWTFITFAVVFLLLQRFAWRPIARTLDQRASKIRSDLEQAEQLKDEAEEKLSEYLGKLERLNEEGEQLMQQRREDAQKAREELLSKTRKEVQAMLERAKREIEQSRDDALQDIHKQVVDLSVAVAGQILERTLSVKDHEKLTSETIQKIKSLKNGQRAATGGRNIS